MFTNFKPSESISTKEEKRITIGQGRTIPTCLRAVQIQSLNKLCQKRFKFPAKLYRKFNLRVHIYLHNKHTHTHTYKRATNKDNLLRRHTRVWRFERECKFLCHTCSPLFNAIGTRVPKGSSRCVYRPCICCAVQMPSATRVWEDEKFVYPIEWLSLLRGSCLVKEMCFAENE